MVIFLLVLYNLATVAVAATGVWLERRGRRRIGAGLLFLSLLLVLNLLFGGALLFVPFILALYGLLLGGPIAVVWLIVRRLRRGRSHVSPAGEGRTWPQQAPSNRPWSE